MVSSIVVSDWLLLTLAMITVAEGSAPPHCDTILTSDGVQEWNCTYRDIINLEVIEKPMPQDVQILNFTGNRFIALPHIEESSQCHDASQCSNETNLHCRRVLLFGRNEISRLEEDALHGLRCLRILDLSYNRLSGENMESKTFQEGAHNIQILTLRGNPLGYLKDHILNSPFLPKLRELDLSNCSLESIGNNSVDDFGELRLLNLSYNKLKYLNGQTFKGLFRVVTLDLRHNVLTFFEANTFGDLINLQELWLSDNMISAMDDMAFYNDSKLSQLHLVNNQFKTMPYNVVNQLPLLHTLNLEGNPIDNVSRDSRANDVKRLILDKTSLVALQRHALASFPALEYLSIRGTPLYSLDPEFLGVLPSVLKEVRLENNRIVSISPETLPWQQLNSLGLGGNPIQCDQTVRWIISARAYTDRVICKSPSSLAGRDIRTLTTEDLPRDVPTDNIMILILVPVLSPLLAVCGILVWRRRRHFSCHAEELKGQYVSVFTRDQNSGDSVSVEMKVHFSRLKTVSNEGGNDKRALIKFESLPQNEADEDEI